MMNITIKGQTQTVVYEGIKTYQELTEKELQVAKETFNPYHKTSLEESLFASNGRYIGLKLIPLRNGNSLGLWMSKSDMPPFKVEIEYL